MAHCYCYYYCVILCLLYGDYTPYFALLFSVASGQVQTYSMYFCGQCCELPQQNKPAQGEMAAVANNADNDDGNHMCLWCGVSSPVHRCGLLEDK